MFKPYESGPCFKYLLQIERLRKFPTSQNVLSKINLVCKIKDHGERKHE